MQGAPAAESRKASFVQRARRSRGKEEGGEDWLREKESVKPKCSGFSRNLSLAPVGAKICVLPNGSWRSRRPGSSKPGLCSCPTRAGLHLALEQAARAGSFLRATLPGADGQSEPREDRV